MKSKDNQNNPLERRELLKKGVKATALLGISGSLLLHNRFLKLGLAAADTVNADKGVLKTKKLKSGGMDISPVTKVVRKAIPSACWSCVTRDSMIGYVEDGRLAKLEGQPKSMRGRGKLCAKGQAGINQLYDPDRILSPMKRTGKRGEGKWRKISWKEALKMIVEGYNRDGKHIKGLREIRKDNPGKFMFHYGRMKSSSSKLIKGSFLAAYGTKTIGNHTSICEGGKWTAQELTWGKHYDNWDFDNTRFILNFGSNVLEAHTNHIPLAQRFVEAMVKRNVRSVTFDIRLSNTAARSSEWMPVKPGTDGAVALAMCKVIMDEGLYDRDFLKFCKATNKAHPTVDENVEALKEHFSTFTEDWAEKISGVPASKIRSIAIEFAKAKPAVVMSYRGAVAHYNGNDTERAIQTLAAITGNIDNPGGRCHGIGAKWKYPKPKNVPKPKKLKILDGKGAALPTHHMSHHVLKMIKDGSHGRPDLYMFYCYNPVYVNGEVQENIDILKDEKLIPFTVSVDPFYSESTALVDLILPDTTYLERWDYEDMVSPNQIAEYHIRQPLVKPLGESRDFGDVVCDLAKMLGLDLGVKDKKDFVKKACEKTPVVKEAAKLAGEKPFEYMKKRGGVWYNDPDAKLKMPEPNYYKYKKTVKVADLKKETVIFDRLTGVYWDWKKSKAKSRDEAVKTGYTKTKNAYKSYVGQKIGDKVYKGFKPDKINKSGYFEIYSHFLKDKGFPALPTYTEIPGHKALEKDDLILTTYKVNVHIHSRSTNCKWLTEIYHDNPALINPVTAARKEIRDHDTIKVVNPSLKDEEGKPLEIITTARLTEGIVKGVIAISMHLGHWEYGRYASGKTHPYGSDNDQDLKRIWWKGKGVHPNWIIANHPDPINGQQSWMDSVVKVSKYSDGRRVL